MRQIVIIDLPEDPAPRVIERAEVVFAVRIIVVGERIERHDFGEDRGLILWGQGGDTGGHEALASAAQ